MTLYAQDPARGWLAELSVCWVNLVNCNVLRHLHVCLSPVLAGFEAPLPSLQLVPFQSHGVSAAVGARRARSPGGGTLQVGDGVGILITVILL